MTNSRYDDESSLSAHGHSFTEGSGMSGLPKADYKTVRDIAVLLGQAEVRPKRTKGATLVVKNRTIPNGNNAPEVIDWCEPLPSWLLQKHSMSP